MITPKEGGMGRVLPITVGGWVKKAGLGARSTREDAEKMYV